MRPFARHARTDAHRHALIDREVNRNNARDSSNGRRRAFTARHFKL
jgi:hypothetical protein